MCFVWISEQTAIISLSSTNWPVFITETECVYCAVRAVCLNTIFASTELKFLSNFHQGDGRSHGALSYKPRSPQLQAYRPVIAPDRSTIKGCLQWHHLPYKAGSIADIADATRVAVSTNTHRLRTIVDCRSASLCRDVTCDTAWRRETRIYKTAARLNRACSQ
jgi:hypothetical protein